MQIETLDVYGIDTKHFIVKKLLEYWINHNVNDVWCLIKNKNTLLANYKKYCVMLGLNE